MWEPRRLTMLWVLNGLLQRTALPYPSGQILRSVNSSLRPRANDFGLEPPKFHAALPIFSVVNKPPPPLYTVLVPAELISSSDSKVHFPTLYPLSDVSLPEGNVKIRKICLPPPSLNTSGVRSLMTCRIEDLIVGPCLDLCSLRTLTE
jgi:hypothetical protein